MRAVGARLRADFRTRWGSWLAVALAIGLAGAVVLTAAAGARRTGTAFSRFRAESHAEDIYISAGSAKDPAVARFDDELEQLPQVEVAGRISPMIVFSPDLNVASPYQFAGIDARYGNTIDRPNVVSGRRPNPDRADEILVNRAMAKGLHLKVGDSLTWIAFTPDAVDKPDVTPADGEKVHLKVVGIGVYPNEVVPTAQYDSLPFAYLTPAYFRAHKHQSQDYGFEVVRLRPGTGGVSAFRAGMNQLLIKHHQRPEDALFADRAGPYAQVERAIQPQTLALGLFALLAGIVFLLIVGQVLARQIALDADEYPTLRAIGMTRRELFAAAMGRVGVISIVGAFIAVVAAALASPLMPIGPARLAEPHPGLAINVAILGLGFVATVVLFVAVAAVPAWRAATNAGRRPRAAAAGRESAGKAFTLAGAALAPTAAIGIRAALRPGRGRSSVPVRSVLITSGLAIAAVVAAFTFTSNLDHVANTPGLYGWSWTFKAGNGFFPVETEPALDTLTRDPALGAVAGANYGDLRIDGRTVAAVGIDSLRGSIFPTLLEGRVPRNDHEVVLGTRTLRRTGKQIGDTLHVRNGTGPLTMRVVGRAIFPKLGEGSFTPTNLGEGAATTASVFADPSTGKYTFLLFRLKPGADLATNQRRLNRIAVPLSFCGGEPKCVQTADRPGDLTNYTRVRGTPLLLAAVLAIMAIGALGHVLVTSVRRRRRDTAMLKTLGLVRRQVSAVTAWQATTMAAVALLIGIPIGAVLGRLAWRVFAEALGVGPESITLGWWLVLAIPATIVLANLIAAVPALLAARTRPAAVLRSE